ncbi:rhomboid family intramembrane serine protease [Bacillus thermotolerans]|uniref:GlpG protein (Membrane protein of glp regulon) n=1 Tax=Bacillus thermotolerans TaxID=1221996 RepID=A0A0F5HV75_BACTR|nr:rhomboid family intramembrane serine protease [Bacillus thermotolerans]KKB37284.1 GlpG protein (membrane protein of glp regulon) [Bacillus thermotolerans]KKB41925.1 GlpG protein (membrane protein of glp regulon) [Bacillus thermotolerans]KKB42917.1 GlpG protein (membrane protein of glp regulon) [Bacillus thermotolerans]
MDSYGNSLFWKMAYFLIVEQDYQIIQMREQRREMLLENLSNKLAPVIRLTANELNWGSLVRKDIERVSLIGESLRKQLGRRRLTVINMYISPYPPVDEYETYIDEPFYFPKGKKTRVDSLLIVKDELAEARQSLDQLFPEEIDADFFNEATEEETAAYHRAALAHSLKRSEEEKKVFEFSTPFFSHAFIAIQVLVFLLLEVSGGSTNSLNLIRFGAKFNPLILEGEWWRFFTPIFLHIGFLHLLMNTFALYFLGTAVERIFGRFRFLLIYLFSGFVGTLASFVMNDSLSAGASGAIFGCFGALLYFGVVYPRLFFRTMGMNIIILIVINLVFGFTVPGIDNAGHIGGLIGGFLAAGVVNLPAKKKRALQLAFLLGAVALSAGGLYLGYSQ